MIPNEISKQIDKKNWPGVIVLLAVVAVGGMWLAMQKANDRSETIADQCRRREANWFAVRQIREDSIALVHKLEMASFQEKINQKDAKQIEELREYIRRIQSGTDRNFQRDRRIETNTARNTKATLEATSTLDSALKKEK